MDHSEGADHLAGRQVSHQDLDGGIYSSGHGNGAVQQMSSWLVAIAIGFPLGALIASAPLLVRRLLIQDRRQRLARTGLRPGVRVRVMIAPDDDCDWALLTVHISNHTKDIWWLQQVEFLDAKVQAVLTSNLRTARFSDDLPAIPDLALVRRAALFPGTPIHPNDTSRASFTGMADGTYEYIHLHCRDAHGPIAIEITLRRMGGGGRAIRLKAVRSIAQGPSPD